MILILNYSELFYYYSLKEYKNGKNTIDKIKYQNIARFAGVMWIILLFLTRNNCGVASRNDISMTFVIICGSSISEETYVTREDLQREIIDRNALEGINSTYYAQYETRQLVSTISIVFLVQYDRAKARQARGRRNGRIHSDVFFFLNHAHGIRFYLRMNSSQLSVLLYTSIHR